MVLYLQFLSFIIILRMRTHNCQETSTCKKVEECSPIMNLLKRRNNLPNVTSVEVFEYVRSLQCDETTDMVLCPEVEELSDYEEEYDIEDEAINEKHEYDYGIFTRVLIDVKSNENECDGHLQIVHSHTSEINKNPKENLTQVRVTKLKRRTFPNVDRGFLRNRKLLNVRSIGNCCWAFFEKVAFKGEKEVLDIAFEGLPQRRPKSIKSVSCREVKAR